MKSPERIEGGKLPERIEGGKLPETFEGAKPPETPAPAAPNPLDPQHTKPAAPTKRRSSALSRERVRQIEEKALRKLRHIARVRGLRLDDFI